MRESLYAHPFSPRVGVPQHLPPQPPQQPPQQPQPQQQQMPTSPVAANECLAGGSPLGPGAVDAAGNGLERPGAAVPAGTPSTVEPEPEAPAIANPLRPQTAGSGSSFSSDGNVDAHDDEPIPWGYRSGDTASTRPLNRSWKYGDDEDLGASRTGFKMPKHLPPRNVPKPLDKAVADAGLVSVPPLALPNADARRPAAVDALLQDALVALKSRPPLPSAAVKHLDAVLEANPHCQPALKLRAGAHCTLAHYRQALADADAALFLAPMDEVSWLWKATAHDHLNEYAEAVDAYTVGLQYEPTNARLQKGFVAAAERLNKGGEKRATLKFRGTKTLRDSEYAFTSSQVSDSTKASARDASCRALLEAEPCLNYGPVDPVSAPYALIMCDASASHAHCCEAVLMGSDAITGLLFSSSP